MTPKQNAQMIIALSLFLVIGCAVACLLRNEPKSDDLTQSTPVAVLDTTPSLIMSDSLLRTYLIAVGIADVETAIKLARFETGNYRSRIFRENNNLFGMKQHSPSVARGERYGHAYYDNWLQSCIDLRLYFDRYGDHLQGYSAIENYKEFLNN